MLKIDWKIMGHIVGGLILLATVCFWLSPILLAMLFTLAAGS